MSNYVTNHDCVSYFEVYLIDDILGLDEEYQAYFDELPEVGRSDTHVVYHPLERASSTELAVRDLAVAYATPEAVKAAYPYFDGTDTVEDGDGGTKEVPRLLPQGWC